MGILDDAIRQHLELKRQHGAESEDLERLENEAFGPATRPGDPEFIDPDASPPQSEEPTTVVPATPGDPGDGSPGVPSDPAPARGEHSGHGETADHPAPVQLGPADEAEPSPPGVPDDVLPGSFADLTAGEASSPSPEPSPPEPPESGIFDAEEFDFDLQLDDDGPLMPEPIGSEGSRQAPPPATPPTDGDPPLAPSDPPDAADERAEPASPPATPSSDEDLLEETPDFLQDAPEGEDLWFEQGPPRDFDFDDDDD